MTEAVDLEKAIYYEAIAIQDAGRRAAYLQATCQHDSELLQRVQTLLAAGDRAGTFLGVSPMDAFVKLSRETDSLDSLEGATIGRFKLLEKVGEGGFGVVYMADQLEPIHRRLALKIVKAGMDTKQVIARFEAERQALALMEHPNIAKMFDAGSTENGRPYFVMELVRGVPIIQYCDERRLLPEQRLAVFIEVCSAIQHAHQKGIIHRDIKPTNILVSTNGDRPVPKVIDFGIAKATQGTLTDKTLFTHFRQFLGTPSYMSPEQAQMSTVDVDTRSDIYSLGVLLYELLTGTTPFDTKQLQKVGFDEVCRRIREDVAATPSKRVSSLQQQELTTLAKSRQIDPARFSARLRGDLDWIVMKAVEKDPGRRYATVNALAEDIQHHLNRQAVSAVPPSTVYILRRFAKRNIRLIVAVCVIAASLVVGTVVSTWQAIRATQATAVAQAETQRALAAETEAAQKTRFARQSEARVKEYLYVAETAAAKRELDQLNTQQAITLLERQIPGPDDVDLRGFEWRWLWNQCHQEQFQLVGHTAELRDVRFSPDGRWLVTGSRDGTVRLWILETRQEVFQYPGGYHCNRVDVSPDGTLLLALFYRPLDTKAKTILWDISEPHSPDVVRRFRQNAARFYPDGERLFRWYPGGELDLSGQLIRSLGMDEIRHLSRDAKTIVTRDEIWDAHTGEMIVKLPRHDGVIAPDWWSAAVSPIDPNVIVTGSAQGARVWDLTGRLISTLSGTVGSPITGIDFSNDGNLLGVRQMLGAVRVYDASLPDPKLWSEIGIFHTPVGNTLAFSPIENNLFVAGSEGGTVYGYRVTPATVFDAALDHAKQVVALRFSPDNRILAVATEDGAIKFWDVLSRQDLFSIPEREGWKQHPDFFSRDFLAFSPDGKLAVTIGPRDQVSVWDLERKQIVDAFPQRHSPAASNRAYWCVEFSLDGSKIYAGVRLGDGTGAIEVWERSNGVFGKRSSDSRTSPELTLPNSVSVSPSGLLAATCLGENGDGVNAILWSLDETKPVRELILGTRESDMLNLAFSPDGDRLATCGFNPNIVTIWDTSTCQSLAQFHHSWPVAHVCWSPDGKRLAASDFGATTKLWDVPTQQVIATFQGAVVAFSPDGTILAVGGQGSEYTSDQRLAGRVTLHYAPPLKSIDDEMTEGS